MAVLVAASAFFAAPARAETFASTMYDAIKGNYVESLALIPACSLLALLAIIAGLDTHIHPERKKAMGIIIAVVFSLVAQNFLEYLLAEGEVRWLARTLTAIYGYAVRPLILVLFLRLIAPEKRLRWE